MGSDLLSLEWRTWLPETVKPSLQDLFYFNPRQRCYYQEIIASVEQFGDPEIFHATEGITLVLPKLPEAHCLFACDGVSGALCGVAIYVRHGLEEMEILHLAISREWQADGNVAGTTALVVGKIVEIARAIKGIERVLMPYGRGSIELSHGRK
jgi:hypothetical protein